MASKFIKYCLQLNLYLKLCLEEEFFAMNHSINARMGLIHLTEDGPVFMKVGVMQDCIDMMLAWNK